MNRILSSCKKILKEHYGENFAGLILYGSMARGKADESSDIDLLVLLKRPFNYFRELRIIDLLYLVQLESDHHISAKPAAVDEFEASNLQLYRHAKREGAPV